MFANTEICICRKENVLLGRTEDAWNGYPGGYTGVGADVNFGERVAAA